MMFEPRGLNPCRVDSATHLCTADKLGGLCSRKSTPKKKKNQNKKQVFCDGKSLNLNNKYKNIPPPTEKKKGKALLKIIAYIWN